VLTEGDSSAAELGTVESADKAVANKPAAALAPATPASAGPAVAEPMPPELALPQARSTARPPRKREIVRIGTREMQALGLPTGFWSDVYYRSMTVDWPAFFASAALIFVTLNAVFGFLYWLGDKPIANVSPDLPLPISLFYFSIETLATVGYGDMHPQTNYGHLIATIEIFTGMCFLAVMTGLIFARFSRPRARFVFANHPVITLHQGQSTLMVRVANARNNTISQATARLWLFRMERSAEGMQLRRYHELKLDRQEHPMFALSWTLFHVIDPTSPLYGLSKDDLAASDTALGLNVSGVDDNSTQHLYARKLYAQHEILWRHRYRDISSFSPEGRLVIDYSKFHDVVAEDG
jgi:inward rectifier potassium channel